jgi:hypothetical protein
MNNPDNPLVSFNTYHTLSHVRSVIAFLQSYYCLSDTQDKQPPKDIDEEVNTGLVFILTTVGQALAFEMARIESLKQDNKTSQ